MSAAEVVAIDWRGEEIRVGDTVLYPRMSGRSCEMTEARVERIDVVPEGRRVYTQAYQDWLDSYPDRGERPEEMWETVPYWRFSLMPLRSTRFRRWSSDKPVFIRIGENVTKS